MSELSNLTTSKLKERAPRSPATRLLQPSCECTVQEGKYCDKCSIGRLQRQKIAPSPSDVEVPQSVHATVETAGQPLDEATRSFLEPRLGFDFSNVRVHTDSRANESAAEVGAKAYTVGNQVVFGRGHYQPGTDHGTRLLAHELTHVAQQSKSSASTSIEIESPGTDAEREADAVARNVFAPEFRCGDSLISTSQRASLQRQPSDASGVSTQFPNPGALTYDTLYESILKMVRILEQATASSAALTDIEQNTLPAYVRSFVRVAKVQGETVTILGLNPGNAIHQRVLRLLPQSPSQQNFLAPPLAQQATPAPPEKSERVLDTFLRAHAEEIEKLPKWSRNFVGGLNRAGIAQKFSQANHAISKSLSDPTKSKEFYWGFLEGIPAGALNSITDPIKLVFEMVVRAYVANETMQGDPTKAILDLRDFMRGVPGKLLTLFDPESLGFMVGTTIGNDLDKELTQRDAKAQGEYFGKLVGDALMQLALMLIGVEEIKGALGALKNSRVVAELGEAMSLASKELSAMMEAKGILKEAKAARGLVGAERGVQGAAKAIARETRVAASEAGELPKRSASPKTESAPEQARARFNKDHEVVLRGDFELCSGPPCPNIRDVYRLQLEENAALKSRLAEIDKLRRSAVDQAAKDSVTQKMRDLAQDLQKQRGMPFQSEGHKPSPSTAKQDELPHKKMLDHDLVDKEGKLGMTNKSARSQRTGIDASRLEFDEYFDAITKRREIGIQSPGNVNQGGVDFITVVYNEKREIEKILLYDVTLDPKKVAKTSPPKKWLEELDAALERLKLGDTALEESIHNARKADKVEVLTILGRRDPIPATGRPGDFL